MAYKFLDVIKSLDKHKIWEEMTSLITSYSKDKNEVVNLVSQSLLHLNNYSSKFHKQISRNDKDKSLKYIKLICRLKHLIYSETSRNGLNCLELSSDCFRIIIVLNDNRNPQNDCLFKQILFEYNKEKPTACPELLKSLSDGCYDQLLHHIYELQNLYAVGHDKPEQLKAFLCLQSLEEDINKLSKCPISTINIGNEYNSLIPPPNNLIGLVKMRSGGIPAQFVFFCPPGSANDVDSNDRFKIVIQLMNHNEKKLLPFIPLVNLQKDINGNCIPSYATADALKCVPLTAKFVLRLSQPLVVSDANINAILSITELDVITTGFRSNYLDLVITQNNSSATYKDSFYSILPNDNQLVFQISEEEPSNFGAQIVTCIPFLLPNQLPKIISILKKQAVINTMLESFLLSDDGAQFIKDVDNAYPINVSIIATDRFQFSFHRDNPNGKIIKFSLSYNEYSQVLVKFINSSKSDIEIQNTNKFQKIIQKFNNIPMGIFWLLYKSGHRFVLEPQISCKSEELSGNPLLEFSGSNRFMEDSQFIDSCITIARSNLSINSPYQKDIFPKIKIEPKLELIATTSQQIISPPSTILPHDSVSNIGKSKSGLLSNQEHSNPPMIQSFSQIDCNNSMALPNSTSTNSNPIMGSQIQSHKPESTIPYSSYGSKHMSLDQMLSSDFAMPFTSDSLGSLNTLSHSMHYADHPSHPPISVAPANYPTHYSAPPHQKDTNPKLGRIYDSQSSVLVNLLNCNENPGSNNSTGFINRPMQRNISNQSPMSEQFESPLMHSHLSRIPQIPRLRMPHPNPSKPPPSPLPPPSATCSTAASPRPSLSCISSSPPSKPDMMMMPYPQDTGNGRALMSRKPRKRKMSTLELNQRLPKQPMMQPPTLRQPMPHELMLQMSNQHIPNNNSNNNNNNNNSNNTIGQQHQLHSISNSNFSSPTTMDQSIYDFDDNTDCGRSRSISSSGNNQSQSNNFNNLLNRKLANTPSKKPLKVKISRKAIVQTQTSQEMKPFTNLDHDTKIKDKMVKSNSIPIFNPSLNNVRSTAIMNAIDSPLTCSSLSSMQTSPHGSVSVSCSQMSGSIESIADPTLMKKRRKRRLKSELEETPESLKKKEKLEIRKQNRKKKEMLLCNGNSQSGMSSNSSLETVPGTDVNNIKAPLPIKLSLNPKTGSISNSNSNSSLNSISNRSSKSNLPISTQSANNNNNNSNSNNSWMSQNNASLKQSMKSESKQQTGLIAEPLLKNYKIPKKKSSDSQISVPFQESLKPSVMHSNKSSHFSVSQSDLSKPSKESIDYVKSEPELAPTLSAFTVNTNTNNNNNSNTIDKPKTPIMLHPDAAVSLSQQTSASSMASVSDQDFKLYPADMISNSSQPAKQKNIHDIVDKLRAARSNSSSTISNIVEPILSVNNSGAIANAISDYLPSKLSNSSFNSSDTMPTISNSNSTENIFEKFSSSKNNGKSDHRQFTNSRFPDPAPMNMQRYPYNRPPAGFPAPKLRPGIGAPLPYGVPRQPFMGNPSVYRMDSGPMRNFSPVNPSNIPYGPKKNSNNSFNNKKK